jgi:hypothetical protein
MRLRVWSAGYLPWSSSGSKDTVPLELIRLKADEQRVLTIPLAPDPANRSAPNGIVRHDFPDFHTRLLRPALESRSCPQPSDRPRNIVRC